MDNSHEPNDDDGREPSRAPEEKETAAASSDGRGRLRCRYDAGDAVILHGLVQSTHVNGRRGVVHFYDSDHALRGEVANANDNAGVGNNDETNDNNNDDDDDRRCMVRLLPLERSNNNGGDDDDGRRGSGGGGSCISVRTKNLTLDYPPGQKVLLQGLIGAKHLNGRVVTIIRFQNGKRHDAKRFLVEVPVYRDDDEGTANREGRNRSFSIAEKLAIVDEMSAELDRKREADNDMGNGDAEGDQQKKQARSDASSLSRERTSADERANAFPRGTVVEQKVKQILVSPKNVVHLPGTKPPPVPSLDQRLVFTGSMDAIVKLLNESVHKPLTPRGVMEGHGFGLLSEYPPEVDDPREQQEETTAAAWLWGKIRQRSYKRRADVVDNSNEENNNPNHEDDNRLPSFYQRLLPTSPSQGRINKVCFNPNCHAFILPGTHRRMKRCTKCRSVAYCDRQCALEAWDHHRKVCRTMQAEGVHFADCVALASPHRDGVVQTQRMTRMCVNRISGLCNPAGHFERLGRRAGSDADTFDGSADDAATAKLLYDAITQGGIDVANQILLNLENPPPEDREVTVTIGFNSLGSNSVFNNKDVQLFANIYGCSVTYRVLRKNEVGEEEMEDITLEPNGDEIRTPDLMAVPEDVQQAFFNFLGNLVPGAAPANNGGGNDDAADPDANGGAPGDGDDGQDAGEGGGDGAPAAVNNAAGALPGMPPVVANFLQHVMNEAGIGVANDNPNNGGGDNDGNAADDDDDESVLDENIPLLEDVADVAENVDPGQRPQQQGGGVGGFHFNFPGVGAAHVHVEQVNVNANGGFLPPGVPMPPPGEFFQMPGMMVGVQVAGEDLPPPPEDGDGGGVMGGIPLGAFQPIPGMQGGFQAMHAAPFPAALGDGMQGVPAPQVGIAAAMMEAGMLGAPPVADGMNARNEEDEEEADMEIED